MSSALQGVPQLIGTLAERCRASAGGRTTVTVRRLLAAYGAERRGRHVLARIRQDLQAAGLQAQLSADEPPTVDDALELRLSEPDSVELQLRDVANVYPLDSAPAPGLSSAVVIVEHGSRTCAGVIVDERGLVLSSALLVADGVGWGARTAVIVSGVGRTPQRLLGVVAATDRDTDTMVIWLAGDGPLPWLETAELPADGGEYSAELIYAARAGTQIVGAGLVRAIETGLAGRRLRCNSPVTPSGLGSPLLIDGRVVGIVNRRGTQHCFAVPIGRLSWLREQAERQRRFLLRELRCAACGAWRPADVSGLQLCPHCHLAVTEPLRCEACGIDASDEHLNACCPRCGSLLGRDDDGLTQLSCSGCAAELDDIELRCGRCSRQA